MEEKKLWIALTRESTDNRHWSEWKKHYFKTEKERDEFIARQKRQIRLKHYWQGGIDEEADAKARKATV